MAPQSDSKEKKSVALKVPKGTRDWIGADIILRDHLFESISKVFKLHGASQLDTPVFELKDILSNKYGEDSKLIYDLADQGGEICAFHEQYPAAQALSDLKSLQTRSTSKSPTSRTELAVLMVLEAVAKGRMREFYQCDIDIAGEYDPMIPDAEILCVIVEVFEALGIVDDVTIKVNHRKVLDGLFEVAGVPSDKIRTISSAVDKLDKLPWSDVKKEMVEEKGLAPEIADKIGEYVKHKGGRDLVELLEKDAQLTSNQNIVEGLNDMKLAFQFLDAFGVADKISFDLSLARGLDYYTGLIFEAVTGASAPSKTPSKASLENANGQDQSNNPSIGVGSIAAGGRYDNLVGMFGKRKIPCVGVSFGVDRIFTILKSRLQKEDDEKAKSRSRPADVFVMAFGGKGFNGMLAERMALARQLWKEGIRTEFAARTKPRLPQQFKAAESESIPIAVIIGEDELAAGKVRVKVLGLVDHPDKEGRLVNRDELAHEVRLLLKGFETPSSQT